MSDTSKEALLLAQAQELGRLGLRLQALEAAAYNATPFARFNAEKKTLTICIPCEECSPWAKNRPFHFYKVTNRTLWIESWGSIWNMVDAVFTCDIDVEKDYKIWRMRSTQNPGRFVITKESRLSSVPLQFELLNEPRKLPHYAIWTKDVEERFCAELDKAWRAFGAEV